MIKIGHILRKYRLKKGYTGRQLSKILGFSHSYVGVVERDYHSNVGIDTLMRYCEALNITITQLIMEATNTKTFEDGKKEAFKMVKDYLNNVE